MSAYQFAYVSDRLRTHLADILSVREQFRGTLISAVGMFLGSRERVDTAATVVPSLVGRFLQLPNDHIVGVVGASGRPTSSGLIHVYLPFASGRRRRTPQEEIARQFDALDRCIRPLVDVLFDLPDGVRDRLPPAPDGWWPVLFHLAVHYPCPDLRAARERWVTTPRVARRRASRQREERVPEWRFQLGVGTAGAEDAVPGAVWVPLGGDLFTASAVAIELLIGWLSPSSPVHHFNPTDFRPQLADLHGQFAQFARQGEPNWVLVKVADSFRTPPAGRWCPLLPEVTQEPLLLARRDADAEYLVGVNLPDTIAAMIDEVRRDLPSSVGDAAVLFRRDPAPGSLPAVPLRPALNPVPRAWWARHMFNTVRADTRVGGSVAVTWPDQDSGRDRAVARGAWLIPTSAVENVKPVDRVRSGVTLVAPDARIGYPPPRLRKPLWPPCSNRPTPSRCPPVPTGRRTRGSRTCGWARQSTPSRLRGRSTSSRWASGTASTPTAAGWCRRCRWRRTRRPPT